jgi:cyclomaltodextrinase / maltogenic alpha-amylase / neopullulanase
MHYKHYKTGNIYELLHIGKNSETLEEVVVYRSLKTGEVWVRPKTMFFETVTDPDGRQPVARFAEVHGT